MKRNHVRMLSMIVGAAAILSVTASAQDSALNGTWRLNKSKSFFGSDHPAADYLLTKTFAQNGGAVILSDASADQEMMGFHLPDSKTTTTLLPDGKEREAPGTPLFPGMPAPTVELTADWQGSTLFISQRSVTFGGLMILNNRYYVAAGGLQLIELIDSHSTFGDSQQRLVFDKQN